MSEVIPFPRRPQQSPEERREIARKHLIYILRRVEMDPATSKKGPLFRRLDDRMIAARATGVLLARAKEQGISVGAVTGRFGRVDRYMLPPTADITAPEIKTRAKKKLQAPIRNYLRLAAILSDMAGWNADEAKIEVLQDTTLWANEAREPKVQSDDERAWHLTLELREMTQRVIREGILLELFTRMRKIPGAWNFESASFRPSSMACLFQSVFQEWFELWSEAPPLPSVPLVRFLHADVQTPMLVESVGLPNPTRYGAEISGKFKGEDQRNALIRVFREIRLCIGPTTAPDRLGPMFESRANVEIIFSNGEENEHSEPSIVDPCWSLETVEDEGIWVKLDGSWHRARTIDPLLGHSRTEWLGLMPRMLSGEHVDEPTVWDHSPLAKNKHCFEHWYFSWTPVDEAHVTHWLDRPEYEDRDTCIAELIGPRSEPRETWYPRPSLAHHVEVALATGALESALLAEIERLRIALEQRESEWRAGATEGTRNLVEQWRNYPQQRADGNGSNCHGE
jgi:hypothetical protein